MTAPCKNIYQILENILFWRRDFIHFIHLESAGTDTLDILPGECNIFNGFPTIQKVPGIKHQSAIKLQDSCKHLAELRKLLFYRMRLFTSFLLGHGLTLMAISGSFMFLLIQNSMY